MIGVGSRYMTQKIRINPMLLLALTQVRARADAGNPHLAHVPLDCFAIDELPFTLQLNGNLT
jgi:hypothetical protein